MTHDSSCVGTTISFDVFECLLLVNGVAIVYIIGILQGSFPLDSTTPQDAERLEENQEVEDWLREHRGRAVVAIVRSDALICPPHVRRGQASDL